MFEEIYCEFVGYRLGVCVVLVDMFFVKIGLIICYDFWFLYFFNCLVKVGVEVFIVLVVFL